MSSNVDPRIAAAPTAPNTPAVMAVKKTDVEPGAGMAEKKEAAPSSTGGEAPPATTTTKTTTAPRAQAGAKVARPTSGPRTAAGETATKPATPSGGRPASTAGPTEKTTHAPKTSPAETKPQEAPQAKPKMETNVVRETKAEIKSVVSDVDKKPADKADSAVEPAKVQDKPKKSKSTEKAAAEAGAATDGSHNPVGSKVETAPPKDDPAAEKEALEKIDANTKAANPPKEKGKGEPWTGGDEESKHVVTESSKDVDETPVAVKKKPVAETETAKKDSEPKMNEPEKEEGAKAKVEPASKEEGGAEGAEVSAEKEEGSPATERNHSKGAGSAWWPPFKMQMPGFLKAGGALVKSKSSKAQMKKKETDGSPTDEDVKGADDMKEADDVKEVGKAKEKENESPVAEKISE